jgi:hypothetical protein
VLQTLVRLVKEEGGGVFRERFFWGGGSDGVLGDCMSPRPDALAKERQAERLDTSTVAVGFQTDALACRRQLSSIDALGEANLKKRR